LKLFSKKDAYIILVLFGIILFFLLHKFVYESKKYSSVLEVFINGKLIMEVSEPGTYPIYKDGERITTLIFNGREARVVNSRCPLKICEKMGWIKPGGEIICVPNKLVIKFKEAKIDAQTW